MSVIDSRKAVKDMFKSYPIQSRKAMDWKEHERLQKERQQEKERLHREMLREEEMMRERLDEEEREIQEKDGREFELEQQRLQQKALRKGLEEIEELSEQKMVREEKEMEEAKMEKFEKIADSTELVEYLQLSSRSKTEFTNLNPNNVRESLPSHSSNFTRIFHSIKPEDSWKELNAKYMRLKEYSNLK